MVAKDRPTDRLPGNLHRIVGELEGILRALHTGIPQEWFTAELTMPQIRVLFGLLEDGQSRMGALAARLGMSLSGATGLMDRLVDKGLVERTVDLDDRRSVVCVLSPQGRELAERLLQLRRTRWQEVLGALTPEETAAAERGLHALARGIARAQRQRQPADDAPVEPTPR